jgi:amylosucrase
MFRYGQVSDLYSGETPALFQEQLVIPPQRFYWLTDKRPAGTI